MTIMMQTLTSQDLLIWLMQVCDSDQIASYRVWPYLFSLTGHIIYTRPKNRSVSPRSDHRCLIFGCLVSGLTSMTQGERRPKRLCRSRHAQPSAVHYLGYVEDEETPEMIMKKFEQLEKVPALSLLATCALARCMAIIAEWSCFLMCLLWSAIFTSADMPCSAQVRECGTDSVEEQMPHSGDQHQLLTRAASAHGGCTDMTEDQLLEVFKQTSIFNVRSALAGETGLSTESVAEILERLVHMPLSYA